MEKVLDAGALGRKVRQYRMDKGYSAEKLSRIAGVSKSHINNIESANSHASADVLIRIANALDTSVDVLLSDSLSVGASQKARMLEYAKLLEDCDEGETKIIVETVRALKKGLKEERKG